MIYLASPYSDPDPAVRQARFEAVCREAARLIEQGIVVFSPIAHSHPICIHGGLDPDDLGLWMGFDGWFLRAAGEVCVLMLAGWLESKGVAAEVRMAKALRKPVTYVNPQGDDDAS